MNIEIYGLDVRHLRDCEMMSAKIYHHDGIIDVKFPQDVVMNTTHENERLTLFSPSKMSGIVIYCDEYFSITIS